MLGFFDDSDAFGGGCLEPKFTGLKDCQDFVIIF